MNKTYLGAHLSPTKRRRGGLMEKKLEGSGTSLSQEAAYKRGLGRRGAVRGGEEAGGEGATEGEGEAEGEGAALPRQYSSALVACESLEVLAYIG